jgi:hypothetical protein
VCSGIGVGTNSAFGVNNALALLVAYGLPYKLQDAQMLSLLLL